MISAKDLSEDQIRKHLRACYPDLTDGQVEYLVKHPEEISGLVQASWSITAREQAQKARVKARTPHLQQELYKGKGSKKGQQGLFD